MAGIILLFSATDDISSSLFPQKYAWNQKVSGIYTILINFVEICLKYTVVNKNVKPSSLP